MKQFPKMIVFFKFLILVALTNASFKSNNIWEKRSTIVHLFEWKWDDIAKECENFLQHKGYGGVQISPPSENLVIDKRPWWERYQPVSYKLITRSGDEESFKRMTKKCNAVGIRIYVDAVINHMTASNGIGTGGSVADAARKNYPAVPYGPSDFNNDCIGNMDFNNNIMSRNCELVGLKDLNQSVHHVRDTIVNYMNHLIDLGVAGFRVDAARHMWPADLSAIYSRLKTLNTEYGFPKNTSPFIFQEVVNMDREYVSLAPLVEFAYSKSISNVFRGNDKLKWLRNWGPEWNFVDGEDAVPFVNNHDNQRDQENHILTYKQAKQLKMATAFMLAHPYGTPRVMSSFAFENFNQGPPADQKGNILSPGFNPDNTCTNGWVCEHRWREIYSMVQFRNIVNGTGINNWWSNDDQQIAFCRGNKGFIAFTNWGDIKQDLQTCLPPGIYCDIISGAPTVAGCTGKSVTVKSDGKAFIELGVAELNGVLAIHAESKKP